MEFTYVVSYRSPSRIRRGRHNLSGQDQFDFQELSYEVLKADFPYAYSKNGRSTCLDLTAYWIKITGRTYRDAVLVRETAAVEGPVSTDIRKAREFCDYLSKHLVFPEHLTGIFEDCIIGDSGGIEYGEDFDRAAERLLRMHDARRVAG